MKYPGIVAVFTEFLSIYHKATAAVAAQMLFPNSLKTSIPGRRHLEVFSRGKSIFHSLTFT